MELLRDIASDGFPTDYVVARVRARRAALTRDWRAAAAGKAAPPATSDEAIWDGLLEEYAWLYGQMDERMRARLAPVFALFELKTLVLCLRNIDAGRREEVDRLLRHSLLSGPVVDALRTAGDVRTALAALAEAASATLGGSGALEDAYARGGLKDVENRLVRRYLAEAMKPRLAPPVRAFLVAFIDLRNVVTAYKRLRWEIADDDPAFITGGSLAIARLAEAGAPGATAKLDALVAEVAGRAALPLAAGEVALETLLLGHLAGRLREATREGGDVDLLLDYVWRLYVEARNRAVLLHASGAEAAALGRELIA